MNAKLSYFTQEPGLIKAGAAPAPLPSLRDIENLEFLRPLASDYPGIFDWYIDKVIPGERAGTRKIIRIERDGHLAALGIAKLEHGEAKICTVRVAESHFGRGIGLRVFYDLLDWLNTPTPHLTVSQSRLWRFERIFIHFGFQLTSVRNGLYTQGSVEFLFNEPAILSRWRKA